MSDSSGNAIGLYFPLSKDEVNALRSRLNYLFGTMGYADEDSTPPYRGGLPAGLMALDRGEISLVQLPDEQRSWVREWLYGQAQFYEDTESSTHKAGLIEALRTIADALTGSIHREIEMGLIEGEEEWEHTGHYRVKGE